MKSSSGGARYVNGGQGVHGEPDLALLTPLEVGPLRLPNRIVMAR